ncbi:limbic system-associated membrane protein-like [Cylas formicarius]|uniref:limbic system-associated membrane protein-like n=1 Tax=Cylas formicarius TaxID=197179 RepID=UPI0029589753|nr:limbic system-associated membrane protein-like [Cylas formicarius]
MFGNVVAVMAGLALLAVKGFESVPQSNELDMIPEGKPPAFVTPGQTYRIATGSTVVLPCRITQPGSYVLAWKRGIAVLTAGPVKVTPDPRVRLLPSPAVGASVSGSGVPGIPELSGGGYSLELKDVKPQDAGDYVCQIGTMEPREITHTLEILVPPRIHYVSHTGPLEVAQGATVKMECRASGNPVPVVSWTRKNNVLPSGERSVNGLSLVIQHADRHSAGQYQCSADNGVGQPDTKHITLKVLYPPEVETERSYVHTGVGLEAQLVCLVHAEPGPQVLWFKDTAQLGTTEQHATQARGNRYTLVIRNVTMADFGNYSCVASNMHGKSRGNLELTGTASTALFDSPSLGPDKDQYNISWSVNSHASVIEYKLYYRQQPRHHHSHYQDDIRANNTRIGFRNDWNNVIIPGYGVTSTYLGSVPAPYPGVTRQRMSYIIRNLQPATTYEARVQAKNEHGWNKMSPAFHFTTRSNDMENMVEPSAQPAVYGISQQGMAGYGTSGTSRITYSAVLMLLILLI